MKIAVNTRLLLSNKMEGIGWFTYEIFKRLTQNHPELQFYFLFDRKHSEEFIFSKNITPLSLFPPARHPFLFYWWFEFSVTKALKKIKPDLFISPDGFVSLSTKTTTLNVIHDLSFLHFPELIPFFDLPYYRYFIPKFIKKSKRIVTVSENSKQDIIKQYGTESGKIDIVHNASKNIFQPVDEATKFFIKNKYSDGCDFFVYAGILQPRKNISNLFLAFDQFKETHSSKTKLLLIGRKGWMTQDIFNTYENMKSKHEIVFLDYLPLEEMARIIASSLGLIYISLFEGFGVPILEAMNCNVPVITSNISSMPEVAGDAALLIDPYSVEAIATAMNSLYKDEKLRMELTEKGKIQRNKFSWDKSAEKMWAVIEKTI